MSTSLVKALLTAITNRHKIKFPINSNRGVVYFLDIGATLDFDDTNEILTLPPGQI